jgi:hypothetical protein
MSLDTALACWLYALILFMIFLMIFAFVALVDSWRLTRRIRRNSDD